MFFSFFLTIRFITTAQTVFTFHFKACKRYRLVIPLNIVIKPCSSIENGWIQVRVWV